MDVLITQKKMTDSEAFVKARGGGNLIGKAMYGGGKITMKQLYLQSFEVVFDAYFKPGLVERFFTRKGQMGGNSQKICMIVEGTRCNGSKHVRAKTGAVRMAVEADAPVVPVFITRNKTPWCPINVIFGEPYYLEKRDHWTHDEYQHEADELLRKIYKLGGDTYADHIGENSGLLLRS